MSAADPGLRRVTVHAGTTAVDLSLPAALPVAALIPPIIDILGDHIAPDTATRYRLCIAGGEALASPTTLAESDIRDGAVLVLTRSVPEPPNHRHDDMAEAVAATLGAVHRPCRAVTRLTGALAAGAVTTAGVGVLIRHALRAGAHHDAAATGVAASAAVFALLLAGLVQRIHRDPIAALTLSMIAAAFLAVAGLLVVPGTPGMPHAMLAATAAAVAATLAIRVTGCGVATLTAVAGCATVIAVAALAGVLTAAPWYVIGSSTALASLGLLEASARMSIALAGLSPRLPTAPDHDAGQLPPPEVLTARSARADNWLTGLLATFSCCAAIGAVVAALATHRGVALAAVTAALLVMRARAHRHRTRGLLLVISGTSTGTTAFVIATAGWPQHGALIAALTAILAATAICLGFVAPRVPRPPVVTRGVEALELAAWAAMAPLACWTCGTFGAIRALDLI